MNKLLVLLFSLLFWASPSFAQIISPGVQGNYGAPTSRTMSLATAYQCTTTTKGCLVSVSLSGSAAPGTTDTANITICSTNAVTGATCNILQTFMIQSTNGLTTNATTSSFTIPVPIGWYFSANQTAGTVTIVSVFDQSIG